MDERLLDKYLNEGSFILYQWPHKRHTEASVLNAAKHFYTVYKRKPVLILCHKTRLIKTQACEVREASVGEPVPSPLQIFVR